VIVQLLRQRQEQRGHLRDEDLEEVARIAGVPRYRVEEVASYFPHFRLWPPADVVVQVCRDMTCHLRDAPGLAEGLRKELQARPQEFAIEYAFPDEEAGPPRRSPAGPPPAGAGPTPGRVCSVRVEGASCLGRCDRAPVLCVSRHRGEPVHERVYAGRAPEELRDVVLAVARGADPKGPAIAADADEGLARPADLKSWQINYYGRRSEKVPYEAVKKLIEARRKKREELNLRTDDTSPRHFLPAQLAEDWLTALDKSLLVGMGGAGAPAGDKWRKVFRAGPDVRYVVANGDESEPGTFKDRELMLRCPELVVEGLILACLLTGAARGYVFIRHEYAEQIRAVQRAIEAAVREGVCGPDVLGTGRALSVEVFVSPGGYICGEQSALLEAMEDRRAQPRNRPPDLFANGLFDMPTVVNNVETLAWAPAIFLESPGWYGQKSAAGTKQGWRLFSVSGDVERPGVYEMEARQTLRDLLVEKAGGVRGGKALQAVATSGPSGGFLPPKLRLEREGLRQRLQEASEVAKTPLLRPFFEPFLGGDGDAEVDVLDFPLDLNFFRAAGKVFGLEWGAEETGLGFPLPVNFLLGAGVVVYAEGTDMLDQARNATRFFRNESCGKCVPCRLGSEKLVQLGELLPAGGPDAGRSLRRFALQLEHVLLQTSICSLGASAPKPLTTVAYHFLRNPQGSAGP
jgi:NADH:ubiquinone oxidoreductase subunit F (NADH-binding)/NADH:ubiquinone oxidoreductase subunit E